MDPKMEAIFEPLRVAMSRKPHGIEDFFELVAGFAETNPGIAAAMLRNATDINRETKAPTSADESYTPTLVEVYRRTFFHRPTAELYGSAALLDQGDELMKEFVAYMVTSFAMDAAQDSARMGAIPESNQSH